jgi:hypothetical protein
MTYNRYFGDFEALEIVKACEAPADDVIKHLCGIMKWRLFELIVAYKYSK